MVQLRLQLSAIVFTLFSLSHRTVVEKINTLLKADLSTGWKLWYFILQGKGSKSVHEKRWVLDGKFYILKYFHLLKFPVSIFKILTLKTWTKKNTQTWPSSFIANLEVISWGYIFWRSGSFPTKCCHLQSSESVVIVVDC